MSIEFAYYVESPVAHVVTVGIPYEDGELPGELFLVDDSGLPRPTIICTNGFGASREQGRLVVAAALARGYNVLTYDGPGQGAVIREERIPMRPDWENVLGPVMDWASTIGEIDDHAIVHFGHGLGGYLVARHATHDHRAAAIVCNDGMTTFYGSYPHLPEAILDLIEDGRDDEAAARLDTVTKADGAARWALQIGQWVCGVSTAVDFVRETARYSLTANDIRQITTPALVLDSDEPTGFAGQAASFARAMAAPVHYAVTRGATQQLHDTVFGYLATTLR